MNTGTNEAVATSYANAQEDWVAAAYFTGVKLSRALPELTSQDILDAMPSNVKTHNHKAMGGVMRKLAIDGWIKKTDRTRPSGRKNNHDRPMAVWRCSYGR